MRIWYRIELLVFGFFAADSMFALFGFYTIPFRELTPSDKAQLFTNAICFFAFGFAAIDVFEKIIKHAKRK